MSEIIRYDCTSDGQDMWTEKDGAWVSFEDYTALQQKLDAALAERDQATMTHDYQQDQINFCQEKAKQSAAENAKLMSGFSFFMYSDESGFETYKTEAEAIAAANEMIGCCREDAASDGWPEETETIRWGVIRQQAVECDYQKASEENGWMGWCDYKLSPETPDTDAILNEVRAEGVEMYADSAYCSRDQHTWVMHFANQIRAGNTEEGV